MEHDELSAAVASDERDGFKRFRPIVRGEALPEFPVEVLPSWLRDFAEEAAHSLQVPLDSIATLALAVWSLACQGKATLRDARPGWDIPLNMYFLVFMRSGSNKSGVFRLATNPVQRFEAEKAKEDRGRLRDDRAKHEVLEKRRHKLIGQASGLEGVDRQDVEQHLERVDAELEELGEAREYRLLASDSTPEAMAELLATHQNIGWFSSEPDVLDLLTGRYGNQPNFTIALKAHSGEAFAIDRRGAEPLRCDNPKLTICVTAQPSVVAELRKKNANLVESGLLPRFMIVRPADTMGHRKFDAPSLSSTVERDYNHRVRAMLKTELTEITLRLDDAARRHYGEIHDELERRIREGGDLAFMTSATSKMQEQTLRIAALLALAGQPDPRPEVTVTHRDILNARSLRDYLLVHAGAFYREMLGQERGQPELELWARILKLVSPIEDPSNVRFSTRELHKTLPGSWAWSVQDLRGALETLAGHGYLRRLATQPTGGRTSEKWLIAKTALLDAEQG